MNNQYAEKNNKSYMPKGMKNKTMGHASAPMPCSVPVGEGFKQVKLFKDGNKGYPSKAFDYKY